MKIRIDRPTDPVTARLWDEAKRACEQRTERARLRARHTCIKNLSSRACIACNRGEPYPALTLEEFAPATPRTDADCCRGDLRLCRCVAVERTEELEDEEWMSATGGEE